MCNDADVCLVFHPGTPARRVDRSGSARRGREKSLTLGQSLRRLFVELSSTLRIKIFRQHLGMYLGGYIAQDVFNAVFTYYVVFVLMQEASLASNLLGTMAIFQFIAVIAMIPVVHPLRTCAVIPYGRGVVWFECCFLRRPLLGGIKRHLCVAAAGFRHCGPSGRGGINYVPWNTYTYIADIDEVVTGQRREGIFAGIMTLTRKASQAGAVMLVGIVMQASGFFRAKNAGAGSESYHPDDHVLRHHCGAVLRLPCLAAF